LIKFPNLKKDKVTPIAIKNEIDNDDRKYVNIDFIDWLQNR